MSTVSALRRNHEFKASLRYTVIMRLAWVASDFVSKKKKMLHSIYISTCVTALIFYIEHRKLKMVISEHPHFTVFWANCLGLMNFSILVGQRGRFLQRSLEWNPTAHRHAGCCPNPSSCRDRSFSVLRKKGLCSVLISSH